MGTMPSNKTMRAMVLEHYGEPLQLRDVARPVAGAGQVLIKIMASGVNPLDLKIKAGKAAHAQKVVPAILGIDAAGVVEAVGEGVSSFKPGDEVFGMIGGVGAHQGTLAEYIAADASLLAMKPSSISMKDAAALPLVFITAWEGLVDRARVHGGQKVLVHGGSGGIGHVAVQLAAAYGAAVFATDSAKGFAYLQSLGVVPIDYTNTPVTSYVEKYTNSEGFDIVFDTVGGTNLDGSFQSVRNYHGHVVSALGWGAHSLAPLSFRGATYSGIFTLLPLLTGKGTEHHGEIMRNAARLVEEGKLRPRVYGQNFSLAEANEAQQAVEDKSAVGKVVVSVG